MVVIVVMEVVVLVLVVVVMVAMVGMVVLVVVVTQWSCQRCGQLVVEGLFLFVCVFGCDMVVSGFVWMTDYDMLGVHNAIW